MLGRGADGRGRGSGGMEQQPAGRGQQQPSRGGGSGRGPGACAPPLSTLSASATPFVPPSMMRATGLSHDMLQAYSSNVVPAPLPYVPPPQWSRLPSPSAAPFESSAMTSTTALSHEIMVEKLTLQAQPYVLPPQWPQLPSASAAPLIPPTMTSTTAPSFVQAVVAVNPPEKQLPPDSTRNPVRPNVGKDGIKTTVKANHFLVEIVDKDLCQYDVAIVPEVTSKKVCRMIMNELIKSFHAHLGGGRKLAYDGKNRCYTAAQLPFTSMDFVIKLDDSRRQSEYTVTIKSASTANVHDIIEFLHGRQRDYPHRPIQVFNVVLGRSPLIGDVYEAVGRSFFHRDFGSGTFNNGLEYLKGFYQSLRPTQKGLSLNIDTSANVFFEPILVSEFVFKYLKLNRDRKKPLSDQDRIKLKRVLKGVKVTNSHQDYLRYFKILDVSTEPTQNLMFPVGESGDQISVVDYFRDTYGIDLKYTQLPAIQAGSSARPVYLPMEISTIVEGQRYSKKLNQEQVTQLLRDASKRPADREKAIMKVVKNNDYNIDGLVEEFGIKVEPQLISIDARVLTPPKLQYHDTGKEKTAKPREGMWNMIDKKMASGGKLKFWACINFSSCTRDAVKGFYYKLITMCCEKGMTFLREPVVPIPDSDSSIPIEWSLKSLHSKCLDKVKQLQLLLIILPDKPGSYGLIKRVCETELGIVSQCCQPKKATECNIQYLENVSLKINVKVGGRNTELHKSIPERQYLSQSPTIIFGADVTHPQSGEDFSPSIAAVVASTDWPEVTKYRSLVSAQAAREEIIRDLYTTYQDPEKGLVHAGFIREHLISFYKNNHQRKPERIIFYRDGVGEGQFDQVRRDEIKAIQKACASFELRYKPTITFVVVQKRHHTRFFPADNSKLEESGNILPGTVVDTEICHPKEFDFYLCSHSTKYGTSRPAHYHVLYDENNFTADRLQSLTNSLCYTYARCTRSVSIVPPVYYAHLAAYRARYYIEGREFREGEALPAIKENVKDVMFYC